MNILNKLFQKKKIITEKEVLEETIKIELDSFKKIDADVIKLITERRKKVNCDLNFSYVEQPKEYCKYNKTIEA